MSLFMRRKWLNSLAGPRDPEKGTGKGTGKALGAEKGTERRVVLAVVLVAVPRYLL